MRVALFFCATLSLAVANPNGFYHQEYNYQTKSSSYKNNELQHKNEDQGFYSKDGDLEGRLRPKVNAHSQHSEYVNPKIREDYGLGQTSSFGQLNAQDSLRAGRTIFDQGVDHMGVGLRHAGVGYEAGGAGYAAGNFGHSSGFQSGSSYQSYGINSNLRQITQSLEDELARELQGAVYDHYRRASAYSNVISQSQIESDLRDLEEALRRNVTMRLQDVLRTHYGTQGIRGAYSYTIHNGRLQPSANYHNQELTDLTRQIEANLLRRLQEQVNTYYHTQTSTSSMNSHQAVVGAYQPVNYPSPIQHRPVQHIYYPTYPETTHVTSGESITTIATRVQNDLNEHLNRILDDTQRRYFSAGSHYANAYNFDNILHQLQEELRANISLQLDNQIRQAYGYGDYARKYSAEDLENLKRQIDTNLITKLNRDFNKQRERYFERYTSSGSHSAIYETHQPIASGHVYYPSNSYNNYQVDFSQIQRQIQEDLSRQIQAALMHQQRRQSNTYSTSSNFNPQANYQATLQQLTAELNRNLTRQLEESLSHYSVGQNYQSAAFNTQLANLRTQLQNDLLRQLQQGLQQSYSQYSSWSSSSSTSSNYRPVRGFDTNHYQTYGATNNYNMAGEDCMMGDDPSAYQQQTEDNEDLTQQVQDPDSEDLTQQAQHPDHEDLTQQVQKIQTGNDQEVEQPPKYHVGTYGQQSSYGRTPLYTPPVRVVPYTSSQTLETTPGLVRQRIQYYEQNNNQNPPKIRVIQYRTYGQNQHTGLEQTQQRQTLGQQIDDSDLTQHTDSGIGNQNSGLGTSGGYRTQQYIRYVDRPGYYRNTPQEIGTGPTQQSSSQIAGARPIIYRTGQPQQVYSGYRVTPYEISQPTQSLHPHSRLIHVPQTGQQQTEDVDFTQQTQDNSSGKLQAGQQQLELGQQTEDLDLSQQTQDHGFGKLEIGQQTEDRDLTQQTQDHGYGKLQVGQQTEDLDLTQQTQDHGFGKLQVGQQTEDLDLTQQTQDLQVGQQTEDLDLTQQTQDHGYGKLQVGQQTEDLDLTQQTQDHGYGKLQVGQQTEDHGYGKLQVGQQTEDLDLTQQTQDHGFGKLQVGQQTEDIDHTQQTQNLQVGQQTDDLVLTQQTQDHGYGKLQVGQQIEDVGTGKLELLSQQQTQDIGNSQQLGQQVEDQHIRNLAGLVQQKQVEQTVKPQQTVDYGKLQRNDHFTNLQVPQEISNSHLTQQQQPVGKLQLGQSQNNIDNVQQNQNIEQLGQETEDFDLTQQTQDTGYGKLQVGSQLNQQHELSQQVEDLTQQTEETGSGKLEIGSQTRQPQQIYAEQNGDRTENTGVGIFNTDGHPFQREINLGQAGHTRQLHLGQQVDDSDLTQQTENIDVGQQNEDLTQQTQHIGGYDQTSDLTQQTQDTEFGNLEIESQTQPQRQQFNNQGLAQQVEDQHLHTLANLNKPHQVSYGQKPPQRIIRYHVTPLKPQEVEQPIEPQSSNTIFKNNGQQTPQQPADLTQQTFEQNPTSTGQVSNSLSQTNQQTVTDAERQSQLLVEKLRQKAYENRERQNLQYKPQPVYGQDVQVGTTRRLVPVQQEITYTSSKPQHIHSSNEGSPVIQPLEYKPQPVYSQFDGQQVQVGTTRRLEPEQQQTAYNGGSLYTETNGHQVQVGTTRQLGSSSPYHTSYSGHYSHTPNQYSEQVNYGVPQQVQENVETVGSIEPIEQQRANEVEQVQNKVGIKSAGPAVVETPVEPEPVDIEILTTTPKTGFWSRIGNKIKEKIG